MLSIDGIHKVRDRAGYTFANINLLGKCNANCYFCLGKDIDEILSLHNQSNVHFNDWQNFEKFVLWCMSNDITKLYVTGQNVDSLQYKYLRELILYLQSRGFSVGIRTNGYLAEKFLNENHTVNTINLCDNSVGYSIHSLNSGVNSVIMGRRDIPNWERILSDTNQSRVAIVVTRYNVKEFYNIVEFISQFPKVKYIQARRISTDTRYDLLKPDIDCYEQLYQQVAATHEQTGEFYLAQQFDMFGKQINFWRTVETNVNSANYFTDGTISCNYFIVEGYLDNYKDM